MILECSCGKMYRVRDDAPTAGQTCRACGGTLRAAGGSSPNLNAGSSTDTKIFDDRISKLERERDAAKQLAERFEKELSESRASSGPALSQAGFSFGDGTAQLRAAQERADKLERQLLDLRTETEKSLKTKDQAVAQAQAAAERAESERRRLESRVGSLESTHGRAVEDKQKTIEALDASIASYRQKLEALQGRLESLELQRTADRTAFEEKLRERERDDRSQQARSVESQQKALADLRTQLEQAIGEKDRQISEQRQLIDREAGERRRLAEQLSRQEEAGQRAVAEKEKGLAAANAALASARSKMEALQKRIDGLEQLRQSEQESHAARSRAREGARARVEEAGHMATDLDHSLDSVTDLLNGLRDRVRRLKGSLGEPLPEAEAAPTPAAAWTPPKPEPAPEPQLSAAAADFAPEPAPAEPIEEIAPVAEPVIAEAVISDRPPADMPGRVEEPSGVYPPSEALEEAQLEVVPEPEPVAAAPAAAAHVEEDVVDAVPLISPPEEEAPAPPPPAPKKPESDRKGTQVRFSWKRK
jgi:chromosome segregation ATPase